MRRTIPILASILVATYGLTLVAADEAGDPLCDSFIVELETLDAEGPSGRQTDAVAAPDGTHHLAYIRGSVPAVMYGREFQGSFSAETVDPVASPTTYPSLAVHGGVVGIAYSAETRGELRYAERSPETGEWTITIVDAGNPLGRYASLAMAPDGTPHIAYMDSGRAALKHATRTEVGWITETVDNSGAVGMYTSIVHDGARPRIAYYDLSNAVLRLATHSTLGWAVRVLDATPGAGHYNSATLGPDGRVHIAYRNWQTNEIRIAHDTASGFTFETVPTVGDAGRNLRLTYTGDGFPTIAYKSREGDAVTVMRVALQIPDAGWITGTVESSRGGQWWQDRVGVASATSGVVHIFHFREQDGVFRHATIQLLKPWFTWTPPFVTKDVPYTFTDMSCSHIGEVVQWEWTYDEGVTATGSTGVHAWGTSGLHPVTLVVTTDRGVTATVTREVPVDNANPKCDLLVPSLVTALHPAPLDGSGSEDRDGAIQRYEWTMGNDTVEGEQVTYDFAPGEHEVLLTVTDDEGLNDVCSATLVATPEVLLTVQMTKPVYTIFETQSGRITATTYQGVPVEGLGLSVIVVLDTGRMFQATLGGVPLPLAPDIGGDILPNDDPFEETWATTVTTDTLGVARFNVPTGGHVSLGPFVSVPTNLGALGDIGDYRVLVTTSGIETPFVGEATTGYEVVLHEGNPAPIGPFPGPIT